MRIVRPFQPIQPTMRWSIVSSEVNESCVGTYIVTSLSDGSVGIEEVISNAKLVGLHFIAITDHDSMSSFSRSRVLGERYGIEVIQGVELSAYDVKRKERCTSCATFRKNRTVWLLFVTVLQNSGKKLESKWQNGWCTNIQLPRNGLHGILLAVNVFIDNILCML